MNKLTLITLELGGIARRNFGTWRVYVGVLTQVQILGAPPPLKFGRAKNV